MSSGYLTNPIAAVAADPWVVCRDGVYYYCYSDAGGILVNAARTLQAALQRTGTVIWQAPPGTPCSKEIWAPELHRLAGRWYIYFAADDGANANHRMYALASDADDPMGPYTLAGAMLTSPDRWAIDGTVLTHRGQDYFIWSGWDGLTDVSQELYIARMKSPVQLEGPRVLISRPEHTWERSVHPINEGPAVLAHQGRTFVIYSANASWTDNYCLGQLEMVGADPLDASAWRKKPTPVMSSGNDLFGPGHPSFIKSPDGREDWIIYHTAVHSGAGWKRQCHAQPFDWSCGEPNFGQPAGKGVALPAPSGQ